MALQHPIPSATLTQKYGPSALGVEPAMFASSTRAYWQPFSGLTFYAHFHPALDLAAPGGTPILASEAGRVVESYFDSKNGGGNKVTVEIRPNVRYTSNHMASRAVGLGAIVKRGQVLGTVGTTGWSTGNHDHFQVTIREVDGAGVARTFLYNPALFLQGGSMAGDPRILPVGGAAPTQAVVVNGPGINIRSTPDLDVGSGNIFATTTTAGIVRGGKVIFPLDYKMKFGGWVDNDDGRWCKMHLAGGYRYCKKELIHFV
jgi:murein DD-endopeptidase MepM/ murein hydrolase activator NlpD